MSPSGPSPSDLTHLRPKEAVGILAFRALSVLFHVLQVDRSDSGETGLLGKPYVARTEEAGSKISTPIQSLVFVSCSSLGSSLCGLLLTRLTRALCREVHILSVVLCNSDSLIRFDWVLPTTASTPFIYSALMLE